MELKAHNVHQRRNRGQVGYEGFDKNDPTFIFHLLKFSLSLFCPRYIMYVLIASNQD